MEIILIWIALAFAVGAWNKTRGNSFLVGLLLSLIFSPLIGFIVVAVTKRNDRNIEQAAVASGEMKKCPQCAESVKAEAKKCRFCGYDFQ